jgi:hypothetical protein
MTTYSTSLRAELPTAGSQAGVWGDTTNNNLSYIFDSAIAGVNTVSITSTSQALTYTNGPTPTSALNQSIYAILKFTGASAATAVYAPPASKQYIIWNNTSYAITIYNSTVIGNTTAAGTGIAIAAGNKIMVWSDGTNFYDVQAQNLTGTLAIANGGTGQVTANAAFNALAPAQTSTVTAGSFVVGATYTILTVGTTNFVSIGASSSTVGVVFTATGVGSGTGTATTPFPNRYLKSDGTNTSFDQFNLASTTTVTAGSFVIGTTYTILAVGTTDFTLIGAASNTVGVVFTATGVGSGTGTAFTADYVGLLPASSGGTGVTTSTGSGNNVLSTSATLTTPTINSPTLTGPALGTPVSGNLANCTFPTLNQNTSGVAANVYGVVAIGNGGTGTTTAASAAAAFETIGAGQSWNGYTIGTGAGQRQNGVTYQNNSGRTIMVSVWGYCPANTYGRMYFYVNGVQIGGSPTNPYNPNTTFTGVVFLVPAGATYSASEAYGQPAATWYELR